MTLTAGKELGHYKIVRKLGSGGMADVYEAKDLKLGRTVALKILPPALMRDPQMVARFQTEVRAVASLNHRSIVTVLEVGMQDDVHFYSMRLLTGGDLRGRIRNGLRAIEALAILRELSGAFEHAHGRGFVHRDVKPENVLFDDEGLPLLTDFGIAKALGSDSHMTGTGVAIGTPRYFSPEQARGKPVDARSDLYSLGIILYEMLTGKPPYDGDEPLAIVMKHVNDPIPALPDEHAHLQPLLEQLMAKDPAHRIASAKELRKQISSVGGFASLTPQPINLGDDSELVQRLLSGEGTAYNTPAPANPTLLRPAPKAPPATATRATQAFTDKSGSPNRAGESYVVADDDEDITAKRARPRAAPVGQIIPYRGKIASPTAKAEPDAQPPPASKGGLLKALVAVVLLGVAGLLWVPSWQKDLKDAARSLLLAPAPQAKPAPKGAPSATTAAPVAGPTPNPAPPVASPTPLVTRVPTPAPNLAPAQVQKSAPTTQPKPVPAPAPATQNVAAPEPEPAPQTAAPKTEPAPQPTVVPAPAPVEQPVAAKPQPAPVPAEPAAPAHSEPEASPEEDDFLRQRAEQLQLERERREAARKKAADAAERKQQQEQQQQAPAEGAGSEPAESPPPQ